MSNRRTAFSLLEVLLALAILSIALTASYQAVYIGLLNGRMARDSTRAQELCESLMDLIKSDVIRVEDIQAEGLVRDVWAVCGIDDGQAVEDADLASEENRWAYRVERSDNDVVHAGVFRLTVSVFERDKETPIEFTLVRWLRDPAEVERLGTKTDTMGGTP